MANIAQDQLLKAAPSSFNSALQMLTYLTAYNATLTANEDLHPFVESSTFADDIKYHGGAWQSDYHFVDYPWIEVGTESDYKISLSTRNVTEGIKNIVDWLSGKNGLAYQQSYLYDYI